MTTEVTRCPSCGEECFVVHGNEGTSAFVGMGRGRKCLEFHADYRRVVDWIKDPKRKQANLSFTEGPERQIAYAVEEALNKTYVYPWLKRGWQKNCVKVKRGPR